MMAKNDFDIDFDFEKEYGFDPKDILDSDFSGDIVSQKLFTVLTADFVSSFDLGEVDVSHVHSPFGLVVLLIAP